MHDDLLRGQLLDLRRDLAALSGLMSVELTNLMEALASSAANFERLTFIERELTARVGLFGKLLSNEPAS